MGLSFEGQLLLLFLPLISLFLLSSPLPFPISSVGFPERHLIMAPLHIWSCSLADPVILCPFGDLVWSFLLLTVSHVCFLSPLRDCKLWRAGKNFPFLRSFFHILIRGSVHAGKCGNKYQLKKVLMFLKGCWMQSINFYYKKDLKGLEFIGRGCLLY